MLIQAADNYGSPCASRLHRRRALMIRAVGNSARSWRRRWAAVVSRAELGLDHFEGRSWTGLSTRTHDSCLCLSADDKAAQMEQKKRV